MLSPEAFRRASERLHQVGGAARPDRSRGGTADLQFEVRLPVSAELAFSRNFANAPSLSRDASLLLAVAGRSRRHATSASRAPRYRPGDFSDRCRKAAA